MEGEINLDNERVFCGPYDTCNLCTNITRITYSEETAYDYGEGYGEEYTGYYLAEVIQNAHVCVDIATSDCLFGFMNADIDAFCFTMNNVTNTCGNTVFIKKPFNISHVVFGMIHLDRGLSWWVRRSRRKRYL